MTCSHAGLLLAAALLATVACDDKPEPAASGSGTSVPAASPSPAGPEAPAATYDDVETQEDFEEEATKEISEDNLEAEIDKLEAEIGG